MILSGRAMWRVAVVAGAAMVALPAWAADTVTSAGPGRIVCKSAASCELSIGTVGAMRYHIDIAALSQADKERLAKHCTPKQKACVATVDGTEMGDPLKVKASKITFYD